MSTRSLAIRLDSGQSVSGLLQGTPGRLACCVLAHGAGAGMTHPFMASIADGLAGHGIATLRYQFPYMERGSKRPDAPRLAQQAVRAAVAEAARHEPELPLFAGGKSFGGRMTSQAQAESPLPGVDGLFFLGFPLHPPGQPSAERGKHLLEVQVPMIFLQGTRDAFADLELLQPLAGRLGARATLKLFPDADHSFRVPRKSESKEQGSLTGLTEALAHWINEVVSRRATPPRP